MAQQHQPAIVFQQPKCCWGGDKINALIWHETSSLLFRTGREETRRSLFESPVDPFHVFSCPASWAPGPWAPGPSLLGEHLTKKRTLEKRSQIVFLFIFGKQKRCAASVRSFWRRYRAEISVMCQKTKVSVLGEMSKFCVRFAKNDHREPCVTVCPSEK